VFEGLAGQEGAWIYQCSAEGVTRVAYEETEHYQVTREFPGGPAAHAADPDGGL